MTRYVRILSTGRYVPEKVLPNAYFDALFPERDIDGWLTRNVGIRERHVMAAEEATSDLALHAARQALARAGLRAADLDLIIVATDTPDFISPATATVLQEKLRQVEGVGSGWNAGTFDLNCACAGWVTALDTAARHILTDADTNHVLVVGAYGMSRFVDYTDHKTCTLFADGAGAVVLGVGDAPGFLASKIVAYGGYYDALGIYTGGVACPTTPVSENAGIPRVQFVPVGHVLLAVAPAEVDLRAIGQAVQEIHQPHVGVLEMDAQFLDRADRRFQALKLGQHLAGLFAAAVADGFFQHRPELRSRLDDGAPGLHGLVKQLVEPRQDGIRFVKGEESG